ncbi:MAG: radical SAM protein [Candidatus Eisenbacteria bacterium]|nr:radical SAM protein [Candidatus Eisenbacteria bacterium]
MADPGSDHDTLSLSEIYASIQGESTLAGWPCVLVRLAGCPFRCAYCDTPEARDERVGQRVPIGEIVRRVRSLGLPLVELTGGEPLAQDAARGLATRLLDAGYRVLIESGNSVSIEGIDPRARLILDLKTPDSGMSEQQRWENLALLKPEDEIKIVLCSRSDYEWARDLVLQRNLTEQHVVHFSPAEATVTSRLEDTPSLARRRRITRRELAEWILADRLAVRLNLQLHLWIWGRGRRGV